MDTIQGVEVTTREGFTFFPKFAVTINKPRGGNSVGNAIELDVGGEAKIDVTLTVTTATNPLSFSQSVLGGPKTLANIPFVVVIGPVTIPFVIVISLDVIVSLTLTAAVKPTFTVTASLNTSISDSLTFLNGQLGSQTNLVAPTVRATLHAGASVQTSCNVNVTAGVTPVLGVGLGIGIAALYAELLELKLAVTASGTGYNKVRDLALRSPARLLS